MKPILITLVVASCLAGRVSAATLVFYNGTTPDYVLGTEPIERSLGPRIVASGIAGASDVSVLDGNLVFPSPSYPSYSYLYEASSFDDGNAFQFSFTISPGVTASLTEFNFDEISGSGGPTTWTVTINGITVQSGTTTSSLPPKSHSLSLAMPNLTGTVNVVISATGASSPSAAFAVGAFQVNGTTTAVPEPSTVMLIAIGALLLFGAASTRKRLRPLPDA